MNINEAMEDEKYRIQRSKAIENAKVFNPTIENEDAEAETMCDGKGGGECNNNTKEKGREGNRVGGKGGLLTV